MFIFFIYIFYLHFLFTFFCLHYFVYIICLHFFVGIWGLLMNGPEDDEEGGVDFALGNVLRLMLFTKKKENSQERQQLIRIADSLDNLGKRLDHIEGVIGKYFYYREFLHSVEK